MEIIDSSKIGIKFAELIRKYKNFSCAVAWGSSRFNEYDVFKENENKFKKIIIGTHFYQTDPILLSDFKKNENVRFNMDTSELFHPKLYLFENSENDWATIIGSHNFTNGAFNNNIEISVLIYSKDSNNPSMKNEVESFLNKAWNNGKKLSDKEIEDYKIKHDSKNHERKKLSAKIKVSKSGRLDLDISKMNWKNYFEQIDLGDELKYRIKMLDIAQSYFKKYKSFKEFPEIERKKIAGFYEGSEDEVNWLAFGSMKGSGYFKGEIIKNNKKISDALDVIPLEGIINKEIFKKYVELFISAFNQKNPIATATRLLAMKRPDYFVCLDSANRDALTSAFDISKTINLSDYWEKIIETMLSASWWNDEPSKNNIEEKAFRYRVALIDNMYYSYFRE
jgi:hypothetical protein